MNTNKIMLTNELTGQVKQAPVGFSFTTLCFGAIPALIRADWKWAAIMTVLAIVTGGLSYLVMSFLYNKLHIKELLNKGFYPESEADCDYLVMKGILTQSERDYYARHRNKTVNA